LSNKLFEIVSQVLNTPISEINYKSNPESIPDWDSYNMFLLLDEVEKVFNVKFTLDETLEIKNVGDFKKKLMERGINGELI
tara:strand:- start:534 stop:776 length:243 start_codon:yes stop_codon:yes gene_type:complete